VLTGVLLVTTSDPEMTEEGPVEEGSSHMGFEIDNHKTDLHPTAEQGDVWLEEEEEEEEEKAAREGEFLGRSLLKSRTILISDPIDHKLANRVIAQLLYLDHDDPKRSIKIFLNSPGGSADDGFAIYDMIRFVRAPVKIISAGLSASAATVIMLAARKEHRFALPNARIMIHQPSMRSFGAAEDIRRTAEQILKLRQRINELYAQETGQALDKVSEDTDRDYWMTAQEAVEYGLISRVVSTYDDLEE
jgi:ATP-dependent Clp protease protease subunit